MDLKEFLQKRHPKIKIATSAEDSGMLLNLYNSKSMRGEKYSLSYHRTPDYYDFLKLHQSPYFIVLGIENGEALATGTFILREGWHKGQLVKYLYHCDLRSKNSRRATRMWRDFYTDFMTHIEEGKLNEFQSIKAHYAVVLSDNNVAIRTLEKKYNFHLHASFKMRNILYKKFFKKSCKHKVSKCENLNAFEDSLNKFYKNKFLGYKVDLKKLSKSWFKKEHYFSYEVKDSLNSVIGGAVIWSPKQSKKIIAHANSALLRTVTFFLNVFFNFPKNNQELKLLYISHIHYKDSKKEEVIQALIDKALDIKKTHSYHMVSIQDIDCNTNAFSDFLNVEKTVNLYTIGKLHSEEKQFSYEISLA